MVVLRNILIYGLLFNCFLIGVFGRRGGFMNFQFICYQNVGHLTADGFECDMFPSRHCDPYFIICVSNSPIRGTTDSKCPVFYLKTESYNNQDLVCDKPVDNRGVLRLLPDIELPFPLQDVYYVRIMVMDSDQYNEHQPIAIFSTSFSSMPSANFKSFDIKVLSLRREESRIRNPNAWLTITLGLRCDNNLYGSQCMTFCRATEHDTYTCSENGKKLCKEGWKGNECDKKDICRTMACAKGAHCIYIDNVPKCTCNGVIGPQCYLNYDPCTPNPCLNGGKCSYKKSTGSDKTCSCTLPFYGPHCTLQFNLCKMDPCLNNGTCTMLLNGSRICKCLPNFKGLLCDNYITTSTTFRPNSTTVLIHGIASLNADKKNRFGIIFGSLFGVCLLIIVIVSIHFFLKCNKKKKVMSNKEKLVYVKPFSLNSPQSAVSNEYGTMMDDPIYEDIDERHTYAFQREENDDYLVPSRPTTPALSMADRSKCSSRSSMIQDQYIYPPDDITRGNTKDNEYFTALPTRTPKKKPFQHFFNSKI